MTSFPLARYRLECEVRTPLRLPDYAGSTLRGAFGGALRAASCMTKQKLCDGCPLLATCPYAAIFETRPPAGGTTLQDFSQVPRPYVIEPPNWGARDYAPGEALAFHLVLAGRALEQLPLLLWAFARALARGIGPGDGKAELVRVVHVGETETVVLAGPDETVVAHAHAVPTGLTLADEAVTLHFETPLRLQRNGRALSARDCDAATLLKALVRRIALMHEFHAGGPLALDFKALAAAAHRIGERKDLRWRDWTRYSSRQQQKMALGGVVGTWTLTGDLAPFLPFLHLGQWLHVGKEATFGLGGYRLASGLT